MTNAIQISNKVGDAILVIGAADPETFLTNLAVILGADNGVQDLFAVAFDSGSLQLAQAVRVAIDAFPTAAVSPPSPAPVAAASNGWNQPVPTDAQPAPAQAPAADGPKTETDNWGSVFTYGIPGAPSCPHGVRVQKAATSKAGKPYKAFVCPTHTPSAFRQKIVKDPSCQMEFVR